MAQSQQSADVNVNEHWVDEAEANDSDMFQGLVRQTALIVYLATHHKIKSTPSVIVQTRMRSRSV